MSVSERRENVHILMTERRTYYAKHEGRPSSIWRKRQLFGSAIPMQAWVRRSPFEVVADAQAGREHYFRI